VDDLDVPHIRLLGKMAGQAPGHAWNGDTIQILDPGLGDARQPVLNTLAAHGLVRPDPYVVTALGYRMLTRLASAKNDDEGM
jgi:hypothetical protein